MTRGIAHVLAIATLTLIATACDPVDRCLDRGGSYNHQIQICDTETSQPGPDTPCLRPIVGAWGVVGSTSPGFSAMSPEEIATWNGYTAVFLPGKAVFQDEACTDAKYASRVLTQQQFLDAYRFFPKLLGLPQDEVCVTEIRCPDERWDAPGAVLFHADENLFTLWDGVFFELEYTGT